MRLHCFGYVLPLALSGNARLTLTHATSGDGTRAASIFFWSFGIGIERHSPSRSGLEKEKLALCTNTINLPREQEYLCFLRSQHATCANPKDTVAAQPRRFLFSARPQPPTARDHSSKHDPRTAVRLKEEIVRPPRPCPAARSSHSCSVMEELCRWARRQHSPAWTAIVARAVCSSATQAFTLLSFSPRPPRRAPIRQCLLPWLTLPPHAGVDPATDSR